MGVRPLCGSALGHYSIEQPGACCCLERNNVGRQSPIFRSQSDPLLAGGTWRSNIKRLLSPRDSLVLAQERRPLSHNLVVRLYPLSHGIRMVISVVLVR